MNHWTDSLVKLNACSEALDWCRTQPDAATAWRECQRGDHMLWLLGKLAGPVGDPRRRPLVGAAAECARLALPRFEARYPNDGRVRACLDMCDRYAAGDEAVTIAYLRAAYAAAYAAAAHAAYAARATTLAACADIVRRWYPQAPALEVQP